MNNPMFYFCFNSKEKDNHGYYLSNPIIFFILLNLVRRPNLSPNTSSTSCPGIGRRIGDYPNIKTLVPIRLNTTNNNNSSSSISATNSRANLLTKSDIDLQKENKFKQIIEQSNVDLSKNLIESSHFLLFHYE